MSEKYACCCSICGFPLSQVSSDLTHHSVCSGGDAVDVVLSCVRDGGASVWTLCDHVKCIPARW